MYQVLSLRKDGTEQPQQFELTFKDLDDKSAGYTLTAKYGNEIYLRGVLREGGISEAEIDELFRNA